MGCWQSVTGGKWICLIRLRGFAAPWNVAKVDLKPLYLRGEEVVCPPVGWFGFGWFFNVYKHFQLAFCDGTARLCSGICSSCKRFSRLWLLRTTCPQISHTKITAGSFAAEADGRLVEPPTCSEASTSRHGLSRQDCKGKNRRYLNLIRDASFDHKIAITGHVGMGSEVSIPGSVTSPELNWSSGAGRGEGLERQVHLCSFSFPGSHISWGIWFSVIAATLCPIFVERTISDRFPVWGGEIFFPQNVLVVIFQTF